MSAPVRSPVVADPLVVDVWMQHPTLRFLQHEIFASLRRWMDVEVPDEELPIELTISTMDQAGVDIGLLSAWHGPDGALITNDEVAAWIAGYPDRLRGVAAVDLRDPVRAVRELRRVVEGSGFVALRVVPWLWERPPNDRYYYPLYTACVELDIPVCTQVGHTGPLRSSEPGRPIPYLDDVALDFPDLSIVAGHIGHPWTEEMVAVARKHPNVYIDTSAYATHRYPAALVDYLRTDGVGKVMFGTNYPMIAHPDALAGLGHLELTEKTQAGFLGGTAAQVFKLRRP